MTIQEAIFIALFMFRLSFAQNDIRMPPSIIRGPSKSNFIYRSDDSVILDCKGTGVPAVTYEWKKNGFELNQNLQNIKKGSDGAITIHPATSMDEGFYQCFVSNQYGTALSNATHLQRAFLDSPAGTPTILEKSVQEGMPFHIQADQRGSFPKATYSWEKASDTVDKSPTPLMTSARIQIAENGDLHFAYAQTEDDLGGSIYKCITNNAHLDIKAGGSYTKLTVTRKSDGVGQFAPTLQFYTDVQTVAVVGENVTLRCFFAGNPVPEIAWSRSRNTLPYGRYLRKSFNTELTISNVRTSDEGDYVCTARNSEGNNTLNLQIRVEAVPSFPTVHDGPYNVNVTEGDSFTFSCSANAKPEATIVWLQDGKILDPTNPPKRFAFSNNKKSLTIRDVCRNCDDREKQTDLTVIQCNASNVHGYAFASGYLNVITKTKVILVNDNKEVSVKSDEEKEVKFECSATSDPSTPPSVRWYKVENNEEQPIHEDPPTVTLKDGALTIYVNPNGTQKWTTYQGEYRCIGDNGYSKDEVTAKIIVEEYRETVVRTGGIGGWWWLFLIIGLILLLLLLILCCCIYLRNKGGKYDVDAKERQNGKDPEKEFNDGGFQDYKRPEGQTLKGSHGSFGSSMKLESDDEGSLNEYVNDPGKFTEDGSFVDAYTADGKKE